MNPKKDIDVVDTSIPPITPVVDEKVAKELADHVRTLVESCTKLTIKVAITECKKDCEILKIAKQIAKVIDELQDIQPK